MGVGLEMHKGHNSVRRVTLRVNLDGSRYGSIYCNIPLSVSEGKHVPIVTLVTCSVCQAGDVNHYTTLGE